MLVVSRQRLGPNAERNIVQWRVIITRLLFC
jgi:hypothetical protein